MSEITPEMETRLLAPCGMYCGFCRVYNKETAPYCSGCFSQKGHQFWGECKLYACATQHNVQHCGLCDDFPCDFFIGYYPEAPGNLLGQRDALLRAGLLAYRKRTSLEKYLEMVKKLKDWVENF